MTTKTKKISTNKKLIIVGLLTALIAAIGIGSSDSFKGLVRFSVFPPRRQIITSCPRNTVQIRQADIDAMLSINRSYVIDKPGKYCLEENIRVNLSNPIVPSTTISGTTDQVLIAIQVGGVDLNLNGKSITNVAGSAWAKDPDMAYNGNLATKVILGISVNHNPFGTPGHWQANQMISEVKIHNGAISNFDTSIRANQIKDLKINDVIFEDTWKALLVSESIRVVIDRNSVMKSINGYYVYGIDDLMITNNTIALKDLVGTHGGKGIEVILSNYFTIDQNTIRGTSYALQSINLGINAWGTQGSIQGNVITDLYRGIDILNSSDIVVRNNSMRDTRNIPVSNATYPNEVGMAINSTSSAQIDTNTISNYTTGTQFGGRNVAGNYDSNRICAALDPFYVMPGTSMTSLHRGPNNIIQTPSC